MKVKMKYTRELVLSLASGLVETYGERLTLKAFQRDTGISQRVIYDLFGSWKCVRVEVGLGAEAPRNSNGVTAEDILELMRIQVAEQGEQITMRRFMEETSLSARMIETRFGSWGALRKAVGLSVRARVLPQSVIDWGLNFVGFDSWGFRVACAFNGLH